MTPNLQRTVFYSWQSDRPNRTNRGFIMEALERAATVLRSDESVAVEPVIDRDTAGVAGSPEIAATIFAKIARADVFVPDVSLVTSADTKRQSPNPNVLLELGFAISTLGWDRVILVMNTAFGDQTSLPFDLRGRRVVSYNCLEILEMGKKGHERKLLEKRLTEELRKVFKMQASSRSSEKEARWKSLSVLARKFQAERLDLLSLGEAPLLLASERLICVHVVPDGALTGEITIDVRRIDTEGTYLAPIGSRGFNPMFNSDGLLRDAGGVDGKSDGFLQLFRNGVIESVNSSRIIGLDRQDGVASTAFVEDLVRFLQDACRLLRKLQVGPPVLVLVSLLGVKNLPLFVGGGTRGTPVFDKNKILLPEVELVDLRADIQPILRLPLDVLWQAAGLKGCSNYDADGVWINR